MSELAALVRDGYEQLRAYSLPSFGADAPRIRLDANESPFAFSAEGRARIAEAIAALELHRYPDPRASALRAALAERTGAHPDELLLGSGSDEVIALLMTALGRPGSVVLSPGPSFVMYRISALAHGLRHVEVPLDAPWQLDVGAMRDAIREHRPALVFLASPNNPTGNSFDPGAIAGLVRFAPNTLFVLDEAYEAFGSRSLSDFFGAHPNVALLGTLSKIGLAAARVGWARLPRALAAEVDKARQPYNLNALSQTVAHLALTTLRPELDARVARIRSERARLEVALREVSALTAFPTDANFFFCRATSGDADALAAQLLASGILVRSFQKHGGRYTGHARITVGTPEENDALLTALHGIA